MPAGAGGPPAPAAVPGVPGPMQRQVDFLSSGCRRLSASGGFDWRDVARVAVPFTCGLFSSAGKFYRSSSVFEVLDQVFFRPLLVAPSLEAPQRGSACCYGRLPSLSSLRAGVCSLPWRWRISARVLMVACLPLLRGRRSAPSPIPWPILDLTLVLSRCKNLAWLVSWRCWLVWG